MASSNGGLIVDADILDIAEAFIELVPGSGDNEVTIPPGAFIEGVNFGNAQGISLDFVSSAGSFEIPAGETVQVSVNVTNTPRAIDSFEIDFSNSAIGANGLQLSNWAFGSEDLIAIDRTLDSEAGDNGVSAVFDASQGGPLTLGTFDLTVPSTSTASEFLLTLNELSSSFLSGTTQLDLFDFGSELITFGPAAEIGAPEVVSVTVNDGLDTSVGDDFSSWQTQRSLLRTINVQFSEAVSGIGSSTVRLTSLGLDGSESVRVPLSSGQLNHSGDALSIILFDVPDGLLQLEILPSVSDLFGNSLDGNGDSIGGDAFVLVGDASNNFYQLTGDFDGDGVVTDTDVNLVASSLGMTTDEVPGFLDLVSDGVIAATDLNTIRPLEGNRVDFPLQGDYDRDGRLDAEDIDLLFAATSEAEPATEFDLDRNGVVDRADVDYWLNNLAQTTFADVNLDGETGFRDFLILSANFGLSDNVGWGNGDLDGDGAVRFADFLLLSNAFEEPTVTPEPETGARFVVDFEELGTPEDQVNLAGGEPFSLGDAPFNFQVAADLSATWLSSDAPFGQQIFGADPSAFFGFAERPVTLTHDTNEAFALDSFVFGPFSLATEILGDPPVELSVTGVFTDGTSETLEFSVETATQVEIGWTNLEAVSLFTADNVTAVGIDDLILRI